MYKLLLGSACCETVFYLPNRFMQIIMVNSTTIEAGSIEVSLLSCMEKIFGVNTQI